MLATLFVRAAQTVATGLRRPPVVVMQSSQDGQCYNLSDGWFSHGLFAPARDSLRNPLVRSGFVKVTHPLFEHPPQVIVSEDQDVVDALATQATEESLADRV